MSAKNLFTVSEIAKAKISGKTSQTVRRELKNKKASTQTKGKAICVELSELMRIYTEEELDFIALSKKASTSTINTSDQMSQPEQSQSSDHKLDIELLKERVKSSETQIQQYKDQIDYLKKTVDKALENQSKTTLLLEHHTKKESDSNPSVDLARLEQRISRQEDVVKSALSEKKDLQKTTKLLYLLTAFLFLLLVAGSVLYTQKDIFGF